MRRIAEQKAETLKMLLDACLTILPISLIQPEGER